MQIYDFRHYTPNFRGATSRNGSGKSVPRRPKSYVAFPKYYVEILMYYIENPMYYVEKRTCD